jgi:uncharacterized protein (DUF2267 family)
MTTDIQSLGDALDAADRDFNTSNDRATWRQLAAARDAYFDAIRQPWLDGYWRNLSAPLPSSDADALTYIKGVKHQKHEAQQRLADLLALGPELYTIRERCDAEAAEEVAEGLHNFALVKNAEWYHERQQQRANRETIKRGYQRGTVERVKAGIKRTGKYERGPNGVRIPIMETEE